MPAAMIPKEMRLLVAQVIVDSMVGFTVDLYTNDHDITDDDTAADFTPVTYSGYSSFDWELSPPALTTDGHAQVAPVTVTFAAPPLAAGDKIVIGYICKTYYGGVETLAMVEAFPAPVTLNHANGALTFDLAFNDFDGNHP